MASKQHIINISNSTFIIHHFRPTINTKAMPMMCAESCCWLWPTKDAVFSFGTVIFFLFIFAVVANLVVWLDLCVDFIISKSVLNCFVLLCAISSSEKSKMLISKNRRSKTNLSFIVRKTTKILIVVRVGEQRKEGSTNYRW